MKKLVSCIAALFLISAFQACVKEDDSEENQHNISGHLYKNCNNEPYVNRGFKFYSVKDASFTNPSKDKTLVAETRTDQNGYFNVTFGRCENGIEVIDENGLYAFGIPCLGGFGPQTIVENTWYHRPKSSHYLKIKTDSAFTPNDTIVIGINAHGEKIKQEGPFTDGQLIIIDSIRIYSAGGYLSIAKNYIVDADLAWGLGSEDYNNVTSSYDRLVPPNYFREVKQSVCGVGDTVVIDLRGYN